MGKLLASLLQPAEMQVKETFTTVKTNKVKDCMLQNFARKLLLISKYNFSSLFSPNCICFSAQQLLKRIIAVVKTHTCPNIYMQ